MADPYFPTAVERELARRRKVSRPVFIVFLVLFLAFLIVLITLLFTLAGFFRETTPHYSSPVDHFKYGSIGTEPASGLPRKLWDALPYLFEEEFGGKKDYSAFGFLYEDENGAPKPLPIGISERRYRGVDLVWFNCATCHVGTYRTGAEEPAVIVPGMPSNNLKLDEFIAFVVSTAASEKLSSDTVFAAIEESGARLGALEKLYWRLLVLPRVREELIVRASRLKPLQEHQPDWGPGRVDTFNPYKVIQMNVPMEELTEEELIGASDFPSIFLQGPKEGMNLHWDGNNASLSERNLSAAIGAGVTPETVDHKAIGRVADWLKDLEPPKQPPLPHSEDQADHAEAIEAGKAVYMQACAACHGFVNNGTYVFEGAVLGEVEPIDKVATDRGRLDSYTEAFRAQQLDQLFAGTPHQFRHFRKTDGYANMPLDGLWLRAPYLHNGSVPTLYDLLLPPGERPRTFLRSSDVLDAERGGFQAPECETSTSNDASNNGFCFDTSLIGNGNYGHDYGTDLTPAERDSLLLYLKTF
ncbi:cytochrome c [Roseibium sp. MMSF_3544]|uniref:c-type cytochrome n=1 Tax=unclassified Roseibium TaxID=2629323 RepID=UPI00273F3B30|nr:cytochrome c [Roseibium sp. MMSF_3544]